MPETDQLTPKQSRRYQRNILLAGMGPAGQARLLRSGVLLIGAGGLGSPAAIYLAAAGVGRIGLVDPDTVSLSNLQRQILHATPDLGRPKVQSAGEKLLSLNPELKLEMYPRMFEAGIAESLIEGYDFVVDCTDNFPARYVINRACLQLNKPFVHGGVLAWAGQVFTVIPGKGPCFRCLFPEEPRPGFSTTADAGVLGTVPGVIGAIQAAEAIRFILGTGELLVGRILTYDALSARFHEVAVQRDRNCPDCRDRAED